MTCRVRDGLHRTRRRKNQSAVLVAQKLASGLLMAASLAYKFLTNYIRHLESIFHEKMSVDAQAVTQIQVENVVGKSFRKINPFKFIFS